MFSFIIFSLVSLLVRSQTAEEPRSIDFDLPDLVSTLEFGNQQVLLEAYRYIKNDKIISGNDTSKYRQMMWVSTGHPTLVKPNSLLKSLPTFQATKEGFYVFIQTLTKNERIELAKAASRKYGIIITENQIQYLQLSKFRCTVEVPENNKVYVGTVTNFREIPLRVDFRAVLTKSELTSELNTVERKIVCEVSSRIPESKTNVFSIQVNEFGLLDDLFEHEQQFAYLTKEQMKSLVSEIYVEANIHEEFDIREGKFQNLFTDDFLRLTALPLCSNLGLEDAAKWLSKFPVNLDFELGTQHLKDLKHLLMIKDDINGRKYITVNPNRATSFNNSLVKTDDGESIYGVSVTQTVRYFEETKSKARSSKSLAEQLSDFSKIVKDEIEWRVDEVGNRLEAKAISFQKLQKTAFLKKMVFNRIRKDSSDSAFTRKFSLYTKKDLIAPNPGDIQMKRNNEIEAKIHNDTNQILSKLVRFEKFQVLTGSADFDYSQTNSSVRKHVTFPIRYKEAPKVFVTLTALETISKLKIECNVELITPLGFEYVCKTWPVNKLYGFRFTWFALGNGIQ
jgi:hypothetical protein